MARKIQISKEVILQTALEMIIRDGFASVNIKTLSKEIGCSTQPLVWHFENMEGLRKALAQYALAYANTQMAPKNENSIEAFKQVGTGFIRVALNEPNLFRFLYLEGYMGSSSDNLEMLINDEENIELIKRLAKDLNISKKKASRYLQNTVVYTYGIATLIAMGMLKTSQKEVMTLVNNAANAFLIQEGVRVDEISNKKGM
ncbi:MAG: TetR/AcrR family transcriptional regulator [Anaerorhabdus sp.]|uniref:TetR/AcrR family transcriptional regulator n=1 Tax=Anaerorhabdus sp. TaxID=1872524 RepID=UPI003A8BF8FD